MVRQNGLRICLICVVALFAALLWAAPAARAQDMCRVHGYQSPECQAFVTWASTKGYELTPGLIERIKAKITLAKPRIMLSAKSWADGRRMAFEVAQRVVQDYYRER
ncbi:MAG: hypothetical protein KJ621_09910 [Proteobacteria bacterium]|nr:hypothetical protein [Pseudomonadota bacterium]